MPTLQNKNKDKKKGFFAGLMDKLDKFMEAQAKCGGGCCCSGGKDKKTC